ncbi:MAG TPA: single-stranded DNA-binding protein [Patescibacteria group bacterium]|nr:single-stranded DNA-binding protein [Patescibacteria group bacterium]
MNLNKAMIIGNLTRDPEVRTTPSGQSVASFSIATSRVWKNAEGQKQEAVEYHNIVAWGKLAEICGQYLNKGKKVYVEGRLQTRDWQGQDGVKRYRTEIITENMIMLDRAGGTASNASGGTSYSQPLRQTSPSSQPVEESLPEEEEEIKVENIPF